MATTVQDIIDRAVGLSVANQGLATNPPDLIYRINQYQRRAFTEFIDVNRYAYQTSASVVSSAGNGNRVANLATLTSKVERVLKVTLPSGIEVSQVDLQDVNAELAPRYYARGETLVEVGTDWNPAAATAVDLTIDYCSRPNDLDPNGTTNQLVSIPDGFCDILVYELGAYFASSDVGRDPNEAASLLGQRNDAMDSWIAYGGHFAGVPAYRLDIPSPSPRDKA